MATFKKFNDCLHFAFCPLPFAQKKGPRGNGARQPKLTAYEKNCMTIIYEKYYSYIYDILHPTR
jgi:hypothetical protein